MRFPFPIELLAGEFLYVFTPSHDPPKCLHPNGVKLHCPHPAMEPIHSITHQTNNAFYMFITAIVDDIVVQRSTHARIQLISSCVDGRTDEQRTK